MTPAWQLFIAIDFIVATTCALIAGWLHGRERGYDRGYRVGAAWASRLASRYADEHAEPTIVTVASRR